MNKNSQMLNPKDYFYFTKSYYLMPTNNDSGFNSSSQMSAEFWKLLRHLDVLVIDDEEGFRETFAARLREIFRKVAVASSGYEGLKKLEAGGIYDVIFLDMFMENHTALDVYDRLREHSENTQIYVVTGADSNSSVYERVVKSGIPIYPKPVDDKIFEDISKMLPQHQTRK